MSKMKIVVAVTGASGAILAQRLLENLKAHDLSLIISAGAVEVSRHEGADLEGMRSLADHVYSDDDMGSPLASSSNPVDVMVVIPASMKTMSAIASGYANNLITRCAENVLKLNNKLVVVPRDCPLSLAAIENMRSLKMAGAIIMPPNVGFYTKPESVEDILDFIVGKVLDCMGVDHSLYRRWGT